MTQGKHEQVAQAITARLEKISVSAGFNTNIGSKVHRGRRVIPEDTCTLFEDEETVRSQKGDPPACMVGEPMVVDACVTCDPDNPNVAAHAAADDICRALWAPERSDGNALKNLLDGPLAYAGRQIFPREDGQSLVNVQVKFNASFAFNPGNP